jgi:hypothetical protein
MKLSFATVLFSAIIATLIAMPSATPTPVKVTTTVLAKADRLPVQPVRPSCAQENWPNFSAACLRDTDDKQAVRGIRAVGDQS